MTKPHILVTGGAGYIGSITTRRLLDKGFTVAVLDNLSTGHREAVDPRASFYKGAIADTSILTKIFKDQPFQSIIHFAAASLVAESVQKPDFYLQNNYEDAKVLVDTCASLGAQSFIFSSTAAVYGEPKRIPILEEDSIAPINPYGKSKALFEEYLFKLHSQKMVKPVIFRYFNVSGAWPDGSLGEAHDPETHLIPRILLDATKNPRTFAIKIFGSDYSTPDGTCVRDYVHVLDLADAHILGLEAIDRYSGHVFNLGSSKGFSVREVATSIEQVLELKPQIILEPRRPGDPATLVADAEKARRLLKWSPEREDIQTIIRDSWAWFSKGGRYL